MFFAFHGSLDNIKSKGTNNLIKEFAKIVTTPEDIVNNYNYLYKKECQEKIEEDVSDELKNIYKYIKEEPIDVDTILRMSGVDLQELMSKLTILEIEGRIIKIAGNRYVRYYG